MTTVDSEKLSAFTELPRAERKALAAAYTNLVVVDDETERLYKAHPALQDKVRATFYLRGFKKGPVGTHFWTNSGKSFKAKYEITLPGNLSQMLELKLVCWCIAGRYLTGETREDWIEIKANYRDQKAIFDYAEYSDPGQDWYRIAHGNTKDLFETLARDLKLLEDTTTDSDVVIASLIEAFIGNGVASMNCGSAEANVLESIIKELEEWKEY